MTVWGHGAKSVHGVPAGYVFPCCGKKVRKYDYALEYADGSTRCEPCGRTFIEAVGEQGQMAL